MRGSLRQRSAGSWAQREQQVIMPESQHKALEHPYHKDRFCYDEQMDSYTCPKGQILRFTRLKRTRGRSCG